MNENATPTDHFASPEPAQLSVDWYEEFLRAHGDGCDEAVLTLASSLSELRKLTTMANTKVRQGGCFDSSAPADLAGVAVSYAGEWSVDKALSVFCQERTLDAVVLENMPRWLTITFPKWAIAVSGLAGTSILAADVLRGTAEAAENSTAAYFLTLASALDDAPAPRPRIADPTSLYQLHLDACIELFRIFADNPFAWSSSAALEIGSEVNTAYGNFIGDFSIKSLEVDYPSDLLPPAANGQIPIGLMLDPGAELSKAAKYADYMDADEKARVLLALYYYPDETLEINAELSSGKEIFLNSLHVHYRSIPAENMLPAEGSVHLDHYGTESRYSSNVGQFEFKLHRPVNSLAGDEYLGQCFLVSDRVTYTADMGLD